MEPEEFEITFKVRVEARSLDVARIHANSIAADLEQCGEQYVDRPINSVRWSRISPIVNKPLADALAGKLETAIEETAGVRMCPGCVNCGPPIAVKAEDACDGTGKANDAYHSDGGGI